MAKALKLSYIVRMLSPLSQNYEKILKKLPQQLSGRAWKTMLYFTLLICWGTILVGTYLLLN